jgi:methyltransferase (TIGR00027 family)
MMGTMGSSLAREAAALVDPVVGRDLEKLGVRGAASSIRGHGTFVTVDFSTEDLFEKLAASGYDPSKKTLFLWEGVTLYLSEEAVRDTMAKVKTRAAPGSVLLADIYGERLVGMMRSRAGKKVLGYTNEHGNFSLGFNRDWEPELRTFVESTSLTVGESFFMGTASGKGPFMVVTEMVV